MKGQHLSPNGLGIALAIISGIGMLILSLLGLGGRALEAVKIMQAHHIWYELTAFGIIAGIIEAAVFSFVFGYATAWLYNRFA